MQQWYRAEQNGRIRMLKTTFFGLEIKQ